MQSVKSSRSIWQVRLRTLLLLMAAIAVWVTYFSNRRQIASLNGGISAMQPLVRELDIADPTKIAVVKNLELWYDDNIWEIYLPNAKYQLCVATHDIDDKNFPEPTQRQSILPGRHKIAFEQFRNDEHWRVDVKFDESVLMSVDEPKEWDPALGSTGGSEVTSSEQRPADKPVVLLRRRFHHPIGQGSSATPVGPTAGVLLWIEPLKK